MRHHPPPSLGCVLAHGDRRYWYDTATNEVLEVDPVLAAVLEVFADDPDEPVRRLGGRFPRAEIERAVAEIRTARRDEGLFAREAAPAAVPEADDDAHPTALPHLTLSLSERCNLRCRYCTQATAPAFGGQVMSRETARQALRWYAAHSGDAPARHVSFYGGEPLLHLDVIAAVVAEAAGREDCAGMGYTVDTNATLIDRETARFLADHRFNLQVSLDGPPEIHDRHRLRPGGGPTHAAVTAGLRTLLEVDPTAAARLRFVATVAPPYPFLELAAYFADLPLFRELGLAARPYVRLNTAAGAGTPLAAAEPAARRAARLRTALAAVRERYLERHLAGRRPDLEPALADLLDGPLVKWHHRPRGPERRASFPRGACRPGARRVHVAPDGSLLPCERAGAGWRIGHVDRGLDAAAVRALRQALLDLLEDRCRTCWARRLCSLCFTAVRPELPRAEARELAARTCAGVRRAAADSLDLYLALRVGNPDALGFLADSRLA